MPRSRACWRSAMRGSVRSATSGSGTSRSIAARALSGGELQRVTLATALDSRLTGTLFVLDEPTIGLHPSDVDRLVPVVRRLTSGDNIAIVVESDERFLATADRVLELGPGAGN